MSSYGDFNPAHSIADDEIPQTKQFNGLNI